MSERRTNYYEFPDKEPDWKELKVAFSRNISKYNVPFFEAESEVESHFTEFCKRMGVVIRRKTIVEYDGRPGPGAEYLYLAIKSDDGVCIEKRNLGFMDMSSACPGGGAFGICGRGAKQASQS